MCSTLHRLPALLLVALLTWLGACVEAGPSRSPDDPLVRVRLGLRAPYTVRFVQPWLLNGAPMAPGAWHLQVSSRQNPVLEAEGIRTRQELPAFSRFDTRQGAFVLNGRRYRGSLILKRCVLVNEVGLEEYLYGVVAREIGGSAQVEALKAQAVVARTYAVAHMGKGEFADDSSFQVYQGTGGETPASVRAVAETRGQVLAYADQIARHVCYHSTCGGHTEDNENVFLTSPIPYLRGVPCLPPVDGVLPASMPASSAVPEVVEVPAPVPTPAGDEGNASPQAVPASAKPGGALPEPQASPAASPAPREGAFPTMGAACSESSLSHWTITLPLPASTTVAVVERAASGRVLRMRLGERLLEGDEIRRALRFQDLQGRWVNLYSTAFRLTHSEAGWVAEGWGWGHGVGMCQWGARGMARAGRGYVEILTHYFPGTSLAMVAFAPSARARPRSGL